MRVVCTGQIGLKKTEILAEVKKKLPTEAKRTKLFTIGVMMYDEAEKQGNTIPQGRILNLPRQSLESLRRTVFQKVLKEMDNYDTTIINTHSVFRWKNELFLAFDFDYILDIQPNKFITFLDEIESIAIRLKTEYNDQYFSFKDIITWREEEIVITDMLSKFFKCPHYLASNKQSPEQISQLMFEGNKKKAYISYPIKHLEENPNPYLQDKIDYFKRKMEQIFITFDPLFISEGHINKEKLRADKNGEKSITFEKYGKRYKFDISEIESITQAVEAQMVNRDFHLIRQADRVISYFPEENDRPIRSSGVTIELEYAFQRGIDVYVIWESSEHMTPFRTIHSPTVFKSVDAAVEHFEGEI